VSACDVSDTLKWRNVIILIFYNDRFRFQTKCSGVCDYLNQYSIHQYKLRLELQNVMRCLLLKVFGLMFNETFF